MAIERVLLQGFINDLWYLIDKSHKIDIQETIEIIEGNNMKELFI